MSFLTISIACIPFLLILLWKQRVMGVAIVLPAMTMVYIGIGFLLQAFQLFTQETVLGVHAVLALGVLIFLYARRKQIHIEKYKTAQILSVIMILLAFGMVVYQLYAVHFSYTGIVNTIQGETRVAESSYPYPLFSDEWIGVAIVKTMIREQSLPFTHPFTGAPYNNFLFVFHVLIAQLSVLVGGVLATTYVWLGIVINALIIAMMFLWWRVRGVSLGIAMFGILLAPYIVNSSNLPMFWYLLPWNVGFLIIVCGYVLMEYKKTWFAIGAFIAGVVLYPPSIVLVVPVLLFCVYKLAGAARRRVFAALAAFVIGAPALFMIAVSVATTLPLTTVAQQFFSILIRPLSSAAGMPPTFLLWQVIPLICIPFALYAAYSYRKTLAPLLVPIALGLVWWALNGLADVTILIDYHRVVAITSLLIFMISVCGMQTLWAELSREFSFFNHAQTQRVLCGLCLIFFLALIPGYTAREGWRAFITKFRDTTGTEYIQAPASPVNRYVHPDDLRIFEKLSGERFFAVGWKGLVLGTLTDNQPVFTKPSTITMNTIPYNVFMNASCEQKRNMLTKAGVSYLYTPKIDCEGFEILDRSSEQLYLMRVQSL